MASAIARRELLSLRDRVASSARPSNAPLQDRRVDPADLQARGSRPHRRVPDAGPRARSAVWRTARGGRGRRFAGALEPLTRVGVTYYEREHRDLVRLSYAEPQCSPLLASRPDALSHVGYFAELMDEWAQEGDPNERLYRLGASTLEALAAGVPTGAAGALLRVLAAAAPGRLPAARRRAIAAARRSTARTTGAWLEPDGHVFTCRACAGGSTRRRPAGCALSRRGAGVPRRRPGACRRGSLGACALPAGVDRELEAVHRALMRAAPREGTAVDAGPARPAAVTATAAVFVIELTVRPACCRPACQATDGVTFQDLILKLSEFWASHGCLIQQPLDLEVGRRHVAPRDVPPRARPAATGTSPTSSPRAAPTTAASARTRTACSSTTSSR